MHWTELLTPYPGGNQKLALQGFLASLKKIEALTDAAIHDEKALELYWAEIVEETARLKNQLVTVEEREQDSKLALIFRNRHLVQKVRQRDGDFCRFCGKTINWKTRNSGRAGTYITLRMDNPANSPEETFVGCRYCAEQRKRDFKEGKELALPLPLPHG